MLYSSTKWVDQRAWASRCAMTRRDRAIRVTVVEPGMVETPFFDNPGEGRLEADDIARAVLFAVSQPAHVDVNEILIRPTAQSG
jgi:NADP-dependent 3-hydroxy acid dehydrogenase YdfG